MKKFLIGILCGFVFAALAVVVLSFAIYKFASKKAPEAKSESLLTLRLEGDVQERPAGDMPFAFLEQSSAWSVIELRQVLERAAKDNKIKGLYLEIGRVGMGWAKAEEVRTSLQQFRKSGKPIYSFLRTPGAKEYFLAVVSDRISIVEEDYLDLKGLRVERSYYKNTLDKIGVQMEVEHVGKFKDFGESYNRTGMSPESREALGGILDGIYARLVSGVAEGRRRSTAEVEKLIDEGPYLAKAALREKLVDALEYEEQTVSELAKKANVSSKSRTSAKDYRKSIRLRWEAPKENAIAFLIAEGDILRTESRGGFGEEEMVASRDFIRRVQELKNDPDYKAVLLRIDSPGGDAIASDELLTALVELSKAKPMVISMSDVAASGGYYMAVTGDPIYAYPSTITGSIGVVYTRPNFKGLYDKVGMTLDSMQRGKNADIDSLSKPLSDIARKKLREGIEESYRAFVTKVAAGRKAKPEDIEAIAQGRAWIASDKGAKLLTDHLGGLDPALEELKRKAKFAADARIQLVPYPPASSLLEKFLGDGRVDEQAMTKMLRLQQPALYKEFQQALKPAFMQGGMLRRMPYSIRVD